jgi:S1-C subfamily serine protease
MLKATRVSAWALAASFALTVPGWSTVPAAAESLSQVFRRVNGSVVLVRTREREVADEGESRFTNVTGVGSGVLVSRGGHVITAAHVVHVADEVVVESVDGERVRARVIASEPDADVALLQLERVPRGAVVARLADSDTVAVGDEVFVVGAPYGIGHTLTAGHVSARHKPNTVYSAMARAEFFQTDAAINQGNSGGPMFNEAGEVIGIVSHIISKSGGFEGLGFAVTSNMARRLLLEEKSFWTGLSGYLLTGDLAGVLNLPQPAGLLVQRVAAHSPSAEVGLRGGSLRATINGVPLTLGGDIILEVQGIPIAEDATYERIQADLSRLHPGSRVTITVLRAGRQVELVARLP